MFQQLSYNKLLPYFYIYIDIDIGIELVIDIRTDVEVDIDIDTDIVRVCGCLCVGVAVCVRLQCCTHTLRDASQMLPRCLPDAPQLPPYPGCVADGLALRKSTSRYF